MINRMDNDRANSEVKHINKGERHAVHYYTLEIHYENKATMLEYYTDIQAVFEAIRKYHETDLDFKMLGISRNVQYFPGRKEDLQ